MNLNCKSASFKITCDRNIVEHIVTKDENVNQSIDSLIIRSIYYFLKYPIMETKVTYEIYHITINSIHCDTQQI